MRIKMLPLILAIAVPAVAALVLALPASGEEAMKKQVALKAGDDAPRFELTGSDGKTHSLEDHLGKRPVIIAWFPKAFTGG